MNFLVNLFGFFENGACRTSLPAFSLAFAVAASLALGACHNESPATSEKANEPANSNLPRLIKIDPATAAKIDFKTEVVSNRRVAIPLHLSGRIEPDYGLEVDVSARIAGRVSEVRIKPGETVSKGQILAYIDSPDVHNLQGELVEARSKLSIAEAHAERERQIFEEQIERPKALLDAKALMQNTKVAAELAEQEYIRQEGLYREKISATKDYLAAKAALSRANVDYEQARVAFAREEKLYKNRSLMKREYQLAMAEAARDKQHVNTIIKRLDFLGADRAMTEKILAGGEMTGLVKIVAPIAGVVSKYDCAVGEVVQPERTMFKITDLRSVQVSADLPEIDLSRVKLGDHVLIKIPSYPEQNFEGVVSYISDTVHADSRAVPIRARLANPKGQLKTNMFAEIDLEGAARGFLAVPKAAIQEHEGKKIVFVKREDGFEERVVTVGASGEHYFEVLTGLSEGEVVATQGSLMLKTELSYQH